MSSKERNIFRYQFLLNYLTKKSPEEAIALIEQHFMLISNFEEYIKGKLIPLLTLKSNKAPTTTIQGDYV